MKIGCLVRFFGCFFRVPAGYSPSLKDEKGIQVIEPIQIEMEELPIELLLNPVSFVGCKDFWPFLEESDMASVEVCMLLALNITDIYKDLDIFLQYCSDRRIQDPIAIKFVMKTLDRLLSTCDLDTCFNRTSQMARDKEPETIKQILFKFANRVHNEVFFVYLLKRFGIPAAEAILCGHYLCGSVRTRRLILIIKHTEVEFYSQLKSDLEEYPLKFQIALYWMDFVDSDHAVKTDEFYEHLSEFGTFDGLPEVNEWIGGQLAEFDRIKLTQEMMRFDDYSRIKTVIKYGTDPESMLKYKLKSFELGPLIYFLFQVHGASPLLGDWLKVLDRMTEGLPARTGIETLSMLFVPNYVPEAFFNVLADEKLMRGRLFDVTHIEFISPNHFYRHVIRNRRFYEIAKHGYNYLRKLGVFRLTDSQKMDAILYCRNDTEINRFMEIFCESADELNAFVRLIIRNSLPRRHKSLSLITS